MPAEVSEIHADIHQSALRLHRTLRNYLLILDLQAAAVQPEPALLSPREVREHIQAGVDEVLRQNQRRQDVVVQVDATCSLLLNSGDLSRMVEELVDNACKFSRQGTPIKVELNSEGRLLISDEGRGLRTEEIDHIEAFRQFDRKKHEQQGLGLGLVLVQKLTARCAAKFSVSSRPGEGTQAQIAFALAGVA
jgi:signal transduction histidine kinase